MYSHQHNIQYSHICCKNVALDSWPGVHVLDQVCHLWRWCIRGGLGWSLVVHNSPLLESHSHPNIPTVTYLTNNFWAMSVLLHLGQTCPPSVVVVGDMKHHIIVQLGPSKRLSTRTKFQFGPKLNTKVAFNTTTHHQPPTTTENF